MIFVTSVASAGVLLSPLVLVSSSASQAAPYRKFIKLPQVTQHTPVHCGPASMQSVLSYYGKEYYQEDIGKKMGTSTEYGTPVNNMVRFARSEGFGAKLHHGITRDKLQAMLDDQHPVIIVIQAWAAPAGQEVDWKNTWDSGHYVVAIGYDAKRVYFMDPYLVSSYAWIPWEELFDRWHDEGMDGVIEHGGIEIIPAGSMKFPPPEFIRLQ